MTKTPKLLNQLPRGIFLLLSIISLTIAADLFIYDARPGLGLALYLPMAWLGLRANRPARTTGWRDWTLLVLMAASAIQLAIAPSFSNTLVLTLLTLYASGHFLYKSMAPSWRKTVEGFAALFTLPSIFNNLRNGAEATAEKIDTNAVKSSVLGSSSTIFKWIRIAAPPLLLSLAFVVFIWFGNAIFADTIKTGVKHSWDFLANIELPAFTRILFWLGMALFLTLLLAGRSTSPILFRLDQRLELKITPPTDVQIALWRSIILLVAVNIIYFFANGMDVLYLWMDTKLPEGVTFADYTHQGVYNLVASVVLAGFFLSILFQQVKEITHTKGIKPLACLWIAQNIFLVTGVALRLKIYVDTYHVSLLRVYVLSFLILVCVGFLILTFRIVRDKSFVWLLGTNCLAVFALFFTLQFVNTRGFVANYNYQAELNNPDGNVDLDLDYLIELGPEAWPVLTRIAEDPNNFPRHFTAAQTALEDIATTESTYPKDWRSWQWRRSVLAQTLPEPKTIASTKESSSNKEALTTKTNNGWIVSESR